MGRNSKERTNHGDNQPDSHDPHGQSRLRSRTQAHGRRQDRRQLPRSPNQRHREERQMGGRRDHVHPLRSLRHPGGPYDRLRHPQGHQGHSQRTIRATRLADRDGGEAKQLRAQRGRSRRLRPLRHRPDHQGHRQRRHATRSAGPTATADGPANE